MAKGSSITKTAVWVLMGMLILGLGGFGAINLSGNVRSIGSVGDKSIPVDQYARQLQQEIRAIEAQTGESLSFARAQEIGLDRAVLQRLVRNRALDNEAGQLGLSIGDETLSKQIMAISAFQGIDGKFDREGYRFALQNSGLSEAEFEASLREEAARTLLQGAIVDGVRMPRIYAETLMSYLGEKRSFAWAKMDPAQLEEPVPAPSDEELRAFYDANSDAFMLPASKRITYAWLAPEALIDDVEVPEDELKREYDNRADEYQKPQRRLVERLVFANAEAADQAAAALQSEETTFEALVEDRGLSLADIDLGDVGRLELDSAGEAVFGAEVGEVVGPLDTDLGPALFRVNGVLPAQNTSFEDARPALQQELAAARAVRAVEARAQDLDDQLAGGVTLEELAEQTKMTLGQIDWTEDSSDGIAAYADFRQAAAALSDNDFPKIAQLDDGGVYAMRLDEALPERPIPFDEAKQDVRAAWKQDQIRQALVARAEALAPELTGPTAFTEAGFDVVIEEDLTRNSFVDGTPEGFMETVFQMAPGDVEVLDGDEGVVIVRLDNVVAADADDATEAVMDQITEQLDQALAQDLFDIFAQDVTRRGEPQIDQRAVTAVHVNFP
jgi:peptidyl-prolyl cis-trans isomerase D